ncbi:hypothetical protein H5J25_08930 [Sphingomonas aliaeris]|uniref:DUF4398 domain-containing protein n=1 Tax=Sphingomonas aliaeris TaxID=2759526 RepID=A0A974NXI5_9SPHN|nr:hypothetical protein [Sphingomonas aliaeris]QQV78696.1 hypothetical protein H5J25_08930 [Sphingomonas aliaeris]
MTFSPAPARLFLLGGVLFAAGGCVEQRNATYPSLLPRPIETRSDAEPVVVVPVAEPDPATDKIVAASLTAVQTSKRDFAIAAQRAKSLARVAKGDPVGGNRWIEAQTALAELDIFHAQSLTVVTDLEQAELARAAEGKPAYPALESAHAVAQAELEAQKATVARLQALLPQA